VAQETRRALENGVPLQGICWYPIINFPGWDDGRLCQNGLWGYGDAAGNRPLYEPLAREWQRQRATMEQLPRAKAYATA
jgi:hypothetical protein